MKKIVKPVLLSACLVLPGWSYADDWSLGVMVGQSSTDLSVFDESCRDILARILTAGPAECVSDDNDSSVGFNISYQIQSGLGFEAGYVDLGEFNTTLEINGTGSPAFTLQAEALYLAGTASFPINDRWSLSGRLGYYDLKTDVGPESVIFVPRGNPIDDDGGLYAGASINYRLHDSWTAQLRYDNFDVDMTSLGIKYTFR